MSGPLPTLERAACGHFVSANTRPSGRDSQGNSIVLCPNCRALLIQPKIERKA